MYGAACRRASPKLLRASCPGVECVPCFNVLRASCPGVACSPPRYVCLTVRVCVPVWEGESVGVVVCMRGCRREGGTECCGVW
eukprot:44771-Eustigmatos_ZCMA.PRE.1